ncbi:Putative flavin carrier protein 3 [Purpureocillium takamizusanense]|uniref:Flavin carrier protein 3 n=1 Tax=Purpureocillium takamizusanense TaxID=2060973 RepID=A0A9Q8QHX0_9HYPO|nr:Putative flavin carrier protein 3 [Purpureocillium takamizusanense]UNI19169.1 Putative flavin carrier protein 3 [Purpureocillium takamizusanense]
MTPQIPLLLILTSLVLFISPASAEQRLLSTSLNTCQQESGFKASLFNVVYTPANNTASIQMVATSSVQGKVIFDVAISAYGYEFIRRTLNPCDMNLPGLCPMAPGKIPFGFNLPVAEDAAKNIPGIAYNIPDLDANVKVLINLTSIRESVACVEAHISNGKTVNLLGLRWATAVVAGLTILSSAVIYMYGVGHPNTAAHIAANSLALFGYFQAQAIIGFSSVPIPPIVEAWTMNFQWSMGIIRVGFMQDIFTWYQRATGGMPARLFDSITTVSVQVAKRSLQKSSLVACGF